MFVPQLWLRPSPPVTPWAGGRSVTPHQVAVVPVVPACSQLCTYLPLTHCGKDSRHGSCSSILSGMCFPKAQICIPWLRDVEWDGWQLGYGLTTSSAKGHLQLPRGWPVPQPPAALGWMWPWGALAGSGLGLSWLWELHSQAALLHRRGFRVLFSPCFRGTVVQAGFFHLLMSEVEI